MLHGMWDLPRPGLEPVSPALAGRFLTTVPPGKSLFLSSLWKILVAAVWRINWRKERLEVTAVVIWVMTMGPKKSGMDSRVTQGMNS